MLPRRLLLPAERLRRPAARSVRGTQVRPAGSARNEVVAFVKRGLDDLSISRSRFDWGIKVPWDNKRAVYVWIEALLNYLTAATTDRMTRSSPALARPPPGRQGHRALPRHGLAGHAHGRRATGAQQIFAHGWLLVGGEKMNKWKLTGSRAEPRQRNFGSDAYRYYFLPRHPVRPGRLDLVGRPFRALSGRARQRVRRSRVSRHRDGRRGTARASGRRPVELTEDEQAITTVEAARADAASGDDRRAPQEALGRSWSSSTS